MDTFAVVIIVVLIVLVVLCFINKQSSPFAREGIDWNAWGNLRPPCQACPRNDAYCLSHCTA